MSEPINNQTTSACRSSSCGCGPPPAALTVNRRDFLVAGAAATGALLTGVRPPGAIAGPFHFAVDDEFPIPADKKFDPAWLRSLYEHGEPTMYSSTRGELGKIGMPVGGICTGQLYLGGDGKLWLWDIFNLPAPNEWRDSSGPHYANPAKPSSPIEQGFAIRIESGGRTQTRRLDAAGFRDVTFRGQYPIGLVDYRDADCPVQVSLEAFSPFIPLDEDDSGLPATVMSFTVRNPSAEDAAVTVAGWLQNAACLASGKPDKGKRRNRIEQGGGLTMLNCSAEPAPEDQKKTPRRQDICFEDFEKGTYEGWTATGTAFGDRPRQLADVASYQGDLNAQGQWTVNTHETRHGEDVRKADTYIGTLTSSEFTIDRDFIRFRIGGGNHPGQTGLNLLVDNAPVRTATGQNNNRMRLEHFDVREFAGRPARLQIVDAWSGGWGQIGIDEIVFTDSDELERIPLAAQPDFGAITLALLGDAPTRGNPCLREDRPKLPEDAFVDGAKPGEAEREMEFGKALIGSLSRTVNLKPGESATFTFVIAWHFDALWWDSLHEITEIRKLRRHYGTRFRSSAAVARYVAENFERLAGQTRLWRDTWYDSTLPYWLLDRTFATVSTLATATCLRFSNGRFYGWEGTYCCAGTCQHVWQYAQAVARTFPRLERYLREEIDFGQSFHEDTGAIDYRGEAHRIVAHDGLAGTILRAYREHTMSADDAFLRRRWPRIKKSLEFLMAQDANDDGILEGAQYNTLDATWYGQIAWISSLYLAAVRAGEQMAREMGDEAFAVRCGEIGSRGSRNLVDRLFNGEYFIQVPDPAHPEANSTGGGCHADQLLGQAWAHQVALGRVVPLEPSRAALRAIWTYCFTPDIGPYRASAERVIKGGRWYAMPGEGGLLLCTWPKGGIESAAGKGGEAWAAIYFNECWTGFEYQVAAHMIWEGLVEEGLAITRTIHDRHHASKRNPWNEIECSDHYARAMAGYGVFLAVCGYEYHGPRGHLAFSPRISPDRFRAVFTAAEGWGTLEQTRAAGSQKQRIEVKSGQLRLRSLAFDVAPGMTPKSVSTSAGGRALKPAFEAAGSRVTVSFSADCVVSAGQTLEVTIVG